MFFQSLRACVMLMDQVGDDREPRLGVRRTFCPLLFRQLGLIRQNSVHLTMRKKKRKIGERKGVIPDFICAHRDKALITAPAAQDETAESLGSSGSLSSGEIFLRWHQREYTHGDIRSYAFVTAGMVTLPVVPTGPLHKAAGMRPPGCLMHHL